MQHRIWVRLLFLLALWPSVGRCGADQGFQHAVQARALLGSDTWSRIVRVENINRRSSYPCVVHALVFELVGVLWIYIDTDGTQSFSLHRDKLAEEKADFGPLLRAIDPGFAYWKIVDDKPIASATSADRSPRPEKSGTNRTTPPNGCFIESLALLRKLSERGIKVAEPMLLSFYSDRIARGHTVLAYKTSEAVVVLDPNYPDAHSSFMRSPKANALELARAIAGGVVQSARILPLDRPYAPSVLTRTSSADTRHS